MFEFRKIIFSSLSSANKVQVRVLFKFAALQATQVNIKQPIHQQYESSHKVAVSAKLSKLKH